MKIAILSDIHGNLPALEAVAAHVEHWRPDFTVVNGDVVNRGPRPGACWHFIQRQREEAGWRLVGGNHEHYVARWLDPAQPREGSLFEVYRSSYWTYQKLGPAAADLPALPGQQVLTGPGGDEIRLTHGSMRGNDDGIYPETRATDLAQQIAPAPAVFCTAHTHRPLVRTVNGTLVVNSGSAGTTFDGDVRASYAQLARCHGRWRAKIVRLLYDRARTAWDFTETGFLAEGGPLVRIYFEEWSQARPLINRWAGQYEAAVLAGELSLAASVDAYLAALGSAAVLSLNGR